MQRTASAHSRLGDPATGVAWAPRPAGFGGELLGLAPAHVRYDREALIRAVRKEAELLRPAVALVGADATSLAEALGATVELTAGGGWSVTCGVAERDWDMLELPEPERAPAFTASLAAARAVGERTATAVVLPSPSTLAAQLQAGEAPVAEDDWRELVDGCALVVTDAVKRVLAEAACAVFLDERAVGSPDVVDDLYAPLVRVLRHVGLACAVILESDSEAWLAALEGIDVLGTVAPVGLASAQPGPRGAAPAADLWSGDAEAFGRRVDGELAMLEAASRTSRVVYAPCVPATASPERVQQLTLRVAEIS